MIFNPFKILFGSLVLPVNVAPATVSQEKKFYKSLTDELRAGLAFNLGTEVCMDRSVQAYLAMGSGDGGIRTGMTTGGHWLIVGGSNAKQLYRYGRVAAYG
jgi:hypothetical protein